MQFNEANEELWIRGGPSPSGLLIDKSKNLQEEQFVSNFQANQASTLKECEECSSLHQSVATSAFHENYQDLNSK